MSAVAAPVSGRAPSALSAPRRGTALGVRLATFAALALFVAWQWTRLLAPTPGARLAGCAAVAAAAAGLAATAGRAGRRLAPPLLALVAVAGLAAVVLVSGAPLRLFAPAHVGELLSGLGQGIQSLPGIGVPYRGVDPWVRIVLIAGGGSLLLVAGLLAARAHRRGTRPVGAAVLLGAAYGICAVERVPVRPYLLGALFAVLLGALLWADRLEAADSPAATIFLGIALAGGLIAAPKLDAQRPWLDYESIVESLSDPPQIAFNWNHRYGPLNWPRDNREMLRIAAPRGTYWKAVDLDTFDGVRWRAAERQPPRLDTQIDPKQPQWRYRIRVTVRDLKSSQYVTAGTGLAVSRSPRFVIPSAPGTFATGTQGLRRGDSYLADVYAPRPTNLRMARAGSDYPLFTHRYLAMALPASVGGPSARRPADVPSTLRLGPTNVIFSSYGARGEPAVVDPLGRYRLHGDRILRRSAYGRMYALAQDLRAQTDSPLAFARAIEALLERDFAYTENPPRPRPGRPPLVSFLFDSKAGYCQQFSGTMALMLRMGGVPARVASGFAPGTYDSGRKEWVVRDVDAHSWVEMYFPAIGWVTFDPTPLAAPARGQLAPVPIAFDPRRPPLPRNTRRADVPARPAAAGPDPDRDPGDVPLWLVVVGGLLFAFAAVGAGAAVRARRLRPAVAPELTELERALRRTGRPPAPPLTLQALERRFARHAPAAAAYVAAIRRARYAGSGERPTAEQRRALRRELAEGLGWTGRLRALFALPPGVH